MKRCLPPLLLGLLLALTACSPDAPSPVPTVSPTAILSPSPTPIVTSTPAPESGPPVWGVREGEILQNVPDAPDTMLVEGRFALPYIENADGVHAYTAINDWYAKLLEDLKGDVLGNAAQALDDYETSLSLSIPFIGYSDEEVYEVVYESETTAAILRTHYAHSSGPFPSLLYLADRFDLGSGAVLRFADFFADPERAESLILDEVVRQGAAHADYDQSALSSAFNREYFYPTAEGLLFFYQPLTLNDQAAVKPEFLVSYGLLEGLLRR